MAELTFIYGAMNCGKSTQLLQHAHNYEERDLKVVLMKPAIDTKKANLISSRLGIEREVDYLLGRDDSVTAALADAIEKKGHIDAILVDEAQFLTATQVEELHEISNGYGIEVKAYGLRSNFLTEAFEGSARLLALANNMVELTTKCRCGNDANLNMRLLDGVPIFVGDSILIDDGKSKETYESVCGACYIRARIKYKK